MAEHHADGGALARTVVTEQAEDFAPRNGQGEIADSRARPKFFVQMRKLDHHFFIVPSMARRFLMCPSA